LGFSKGEYTQGMDPGLIGFNEDLANDFHGPVNDKYAGIGYAIRGLSRLVIGV
jgi:hypothetical protein